ncbi:hypothetical protein [Marinobacter sp. SS21]|uniref:hypothetical protein n=1 Tax=Marinobacter sp. SS21 TaxID=2979460 RepID=UPI00232C8C1C|nr:hypothetical protein [Marinobacter sp. SS21]MDC0662501.1 hypothetical protein [Marinobacter sp. SS21]
MTTHEVLLERGLLQIIARELKSDEVVLEHENRAYDVCIVGQEVLKSFVSFGEAMHFLEMLAPSN